MHSMKFTDQDLCVNMQLIGWKDGVNRLLVDIEEIKCLTNLSSLNSDAESIYELYMQNPSLILEPGSCWKDFVLSPARPSLQQKLRAIIQKIEISKTLTNQIDPYLRLYLKFCKWKILKMHWTFIHIFVTGLFKEKKKEENNSITLTKPYRT